MRKKIIKISAIALCVLSTLLVVGYWQLKSRLPDALKFGIEQARSRGVDISFEQIIPPQDSVIDLKNVKISAKQSPISTTIDSLKIKVSPSLSIRPLNVVILLNHPSVLKVPAAPETNPAKSETAAPQIAEPPLWMALAFALSPLKIMITNLEAVPWGVHSADIKIQSTGPSFSWSQPISWTLYHELELKDWALPKLPKGPKIMTAGSFNLEYPLVKLSSATLFFGPIRIQALGKYDLKSQKWGLDFEIPKNNISNWIKSNEVSPIPGLKSADGSISLRASTQGLGSDLNSIYTEGMLKAEHVELIVETPKLSGNIALNIDSTFSKSDSLVLNGEVDLNMDKTQISIDKIFEKTKQIPLNANLKISGKNDQFRIEQGDFNFHNLKAKIQGTVLNGPKITSQLQATLDKTSLQGWEQFLPFLPNIKTRGIIEGGITYAGTADDWKAASVDLSLKAKEVEIPILKEWIPNKELQITGTSKLNSDTKISFSNGQLKTLITKTQITLTDSNIAYSDMFMKPKGTPLSASINVSSNSKEASLKDSFFNLASIRASLEGKVSNFTKPSVDLRVSTNSVELKELQKLVPLSEKSQVKVSSGFVSSKASLNGPLLTKGQLPRIKFETSITKASFDLPPQTQQSAIQVRALGGSITGLLSEGDLAEFKMEPINFSVFNGSVGLRMLCRSQTKTLKCQQTITGSKISATHFLEFMSPKARGILDGNLSGDFDGSFTGTSAEEIKKSLTGHGSFVLNDGNLNTFNLIERPLENLKKFPPVANLINQAPRNQTIKETRARYELTGGKLVFIDLKMNSPYFDLTTPQVSIDMDQKIYSKVIWTPKESLLKKQILDMVRDETGKPAIPLLVEGSISSPSISLEENTVEKRLTGYAKKILEEQANRALSDIKNNQLNAAKEKLKKSFEGLFKR